MRIVILGSGVVGQATGRGLLAKGHQVTFLDVNQALIARLHREALQAHVIDADMAVGEADIIMVCVSTPPCAETESVNLHYIKAGMKTVASLLKQQEKWPVVVIRSTVPPTTTERILVPLIEEHSQRVVGKDFGVCMNPEFLRAKSAAEDFAHPWATVIGQWDQASGDVLEQLYEPFGGKILRTSLAEAELTKYISNLRNALIISFSNEMWRLGRLLGIDANSALRAATETAEPAWNSQYGSTGGSPYGGSCLPKDANGLRQFAQQRGWDLPLLSAVIEVNDVMDALAEQGMVPGSQISGHNWRPSPAYANGRSSSGPEPQPFPLLPSHG